MQKLKLIFIMMMYVISSQGFAAKAVCTVKNIQTNQTYQAVKGKRSYATARKESARMALEKCAKTAYQNQYCRFNGCYKR